MVILGAGLGGVMQVLVIIVQNAVPHSELGVATSGATFFRSIGGSFGTAIFGAIFANVLVGNLVTHLHGLSLPPNFHTEDITPEVLARLPVLVHQGLVDAYAQTIQTVFEVSVPICALAFLASWLIPHVELRKWPEAPKADGGASPALEEVEASVAASAPAPALVAEATTVRTSANGLAPEAAFGPVSQSWSQAPEPS